MQEMQQKKLMTMQVQGFNAEQLSKERVNAPLQGSPIKTKEDDNLVKKIGMSEGRQLAVKSFQLMDGEKEGSGFERNQH